MNAITINDKNLTIEKSKTFAKAAAIYGTTEYNQLQEVRRAYPNYREVIVKQKHSGRAEFGKLNINFMDEYVKKHLEDDDLKVEYLELRGLDEKWVKDENGFAADFQTIKDWFLNTFPEFEKSLNDRRALLEKIEAKKKARLAARKKAA